MPAKRMLLAFVLVLSGYVAGYLSHKLKLPPYGVLASLRTAMAETRAPEGPGRFSPMRAPSDGLSPEIRERPSRFSISRGNR